MADISKQKSTVESKKSKTRKGSQAVACLPCIKNKNAFLKLFDSYPTTLSRHSSRQHKDKIPLAELKKYIYPLDHEKIKAALEEFMPCYHQSQISVTDHLVNLRIYNHRSQPKDLLLSHIFLL